MKLTHIDLFSGIGGFALAAQWAGFKTVAFVEIEPYAQQIIIQNFGAVADAGCGSSEHRRETGDMVSESGTTEGKAQQRQRRWDTARDSRPTLYGDIRTFDGTKYRGATLLTGGFPCQPFSQAGKRRGAADDRAIWPEMFRVIQEARPAWVLGENVAGIVTMELDRVLSDLEGEGYAVQPIIIPACAVDAKHRRDRVWIVGHANSRRNAEGRSEGSAFAGEVVAERPREARQLRRDESAQWISGTSQDVANAASESADGYAGGTRAPYAMLGSGSYCVWPDERDWFAESGMGRVASRIPNRVDRLKGLGNSIVPQVAFEIIKGIADIELASQ